MPNRQTTEPGRVTGVIVGLLMALGSAGISSIGPTEDPGAEQRTPRAAETEGVQALPSEDEALLAELQVEAEGQRSGYTRSSFRHWVDQDGDGCDARQEVLIAESLTPVELEPDKCRVVSGEWFSEFDAVVETVPSRLDVDHLVPLAEAWDSGASDWESEERRSYANNLDETEALIAVSASSNRSKGDKDPFEWMPPRRDYWCTYARSWVSVKVKWELSADPDEAATLRSVLAECASP